MSLTTDLRHITQPNRDLVEWLESIVDLERRYQICLEVALQLQELEVPDKKITRCIVQLADKSFLKLHRLTEDEISSFCHIGRDNLSTASIDEEDNAVCGPDSDDEGDNLIQELQEEIPDKHLSNVSIEDNELKESSVLVESSVLMFDKTQNDTEVCDPEENNKTQSTTPSELEERHNIGEIVSKSQSDQIDKRENINFEKSNETHSVDHLPIKDKVKEIIVEERKLLTQKSKGNSLQNKTDKEILEAPSISYNDNNLNCAQQINDEINQNNLQLGKQCNDQPCPDKDVLGKQMQIESSKVKNFEAISLNEHKRSELSSKEGGLISVTEESTTSSMKIKPVINKEELLRMKSLKEQIGKHLSKKNVHLQASSMKMPPILTGGENTPSAESVPNKTEENGQKPLIKVRENLFELKSDKAEKYPEIKTHQTNTTCLIESKIKSSEELIRNTNIGEPYFSQNSSKGKERLKHNEKTSRILLQSEGSNNLRLEDMKQFNAELHNIKSIAESRKRVSQDTEEKIKTVKKKRFSDRSKSKGQETQKQEKPLEDSKNTVTQTKSINDRQIPQKPIIRSLLDCNVDAHQSQIQENLEINSGNNITKINMPQTVSSEGNRGSLTVNQNMTINEEYITIRSLLGSNVDTCQLQPCNRHEITGDKATNTNSSQVMETECNKTSTKTGQKSSTGKTLNETISNLRRRQSLDSARVFGNNPILENQLSSQSNVALGMKNSLKDGNIPCAENSIRAASLILASSDVPLRSNLSQSGENRMVSQSLTGLLNNQNLTSRQSTGVTATEKTQTVSVTSSHPIMGKTSLPEPVEKAIQRFLYHFCNGSDENLGCIPTQVRSSLNECSSYLQRPPSKNVTEFLKLYMVCYTVIFKDDELRKKISKIAELLHLSIADFLRRKERSEQAKKLQSEVLRKEEISRANKDYEDIVISRGIQFTKMFSSILPKINQAKGCEHLMLVTFYFKITQALTKIDSENSFYVLTVRDLMKQLLKSSKPELQLSRSCSLMFEVPIHDLGSSCLFVKQCLLTLYMSGYHEEETANFWDLVKFKPHISNFEKIIAEMWSQPNPRTQTVGSSNIPNASVTGQMPATLESLRVDPREQTGLQIPVNALQQTSGLRSDPSQIIGQVQQAGYAQNMMAQRSQNAKQTQLHQRPNLTVGVGVHSQLPPFASLNHPQVLFQHLPQRNLPASPNIQVNQGSYHPANRIPHQATKNSPPVSSQPQASRHVNIISKPYYQPPPPYPGSVMRSRVGSETNQLWQPVGAVNKTAAPYNASVSGTYQEVAASDAQNMNTASDDLTLSMTQMCAKSGCSKLATLVCSLCREAVYCTTQCQEKDWYENHSKACLQRS